MSSSWLPLLLHQPYDLGKNMKAISVLALLAVLSISLAKGSPIEDLASPEQAVRDKAAAGLHATFQGAPETKWTPTIEKIKKGQTKKEILELLRPFDVIEEVGAGKILA